MDTTLEDYGTLLYNQSRRDKKETKMEAKLSFPRQDKTAQGTSKVGTMVIIRSDDDLQDPSGMPRRWKLSLRQNESIATQKLSSSSDSASESENEEVASNDSNDRSL